MLNRLVSPFSLQICFCGWARLTFMIPWEPQWIYKGISLCLFRPPTHFLTQYFPPGAPYKLCSADTSEVSLPDLVIIQDVTNGWKKRWIPRKMTNWTQSSAVLLESIKIFPGIFTYFILNSTPKRVSRNNFPPTLPFPLA